MSPLLLAVQALNGLQLGVILFLVAAGLTLVFGVMDFINLAHGVQYMLGAYLAATAIAAVGHFGIGLALGILGSLVIGLVLEVLVFRWLARRDHLEQVLATFGIIMFLTEAAKAIFGGGAIAMPTPEALSGAVPLMPGLLYPVWRLVIIAAGIAVAVLLWVLVQRTRVGMLVRAGASNAPMVSALGVDIDRVFMLVFAVGAMLAGFAGAMAAPVLAVEPTMGDQVLILAFVVIVIGGVGSIRGAFIAALMVGLVDTLGRVIATDLLKLVLGASAGAQAGPAFASMAIYLMMAAVLAIRPRGLFPANG